MSAWKLTGIVAGAGGIVGSAVAVMASLTGATVCGAGEAGRPCYELIRTMSLRVGLLAGVMTVIMVLLVAGLIRMLSQDDRQRAERAMEAYLAGEGGDGTSGS